MRRALGACLSLLAATVVLQPPAWALERELAGVRLGTRALTLLNRPGFGQPDFIGPLAPPRPRLLPRRPAAPGPAAHARAALLAPVAARACEGGPACGVARACEGAPACAGAEAPVAACGAGPACAARPARGWRWT
jgi:hypothetical protein